MPEFDEELLSAYLDGELPADERLRIEQWLAEQPESRQLLEELRSIKNSLERLPRDRLPHDFAEHVLRQAEREVLTSRDHEGASAHDSGPLEVRLAGPLDAQEIADRPAGLSWQRLRRPVLWASLTLAAGLLLMFLDRERPGPAGGRQVAMAPAEAPPRGEIGAPADEPDEGRALQRGTERSDTTVAAPARPSASAPSSDREPAPAAGPATRGEPESETSALGGRMAGARSRAVGKPNEPIDGLEPESLGIKDASKRERFGERLQRSVPIVADQTLVVWCDVSPDKKYNERFRQLLTSNSIEWNEDEQAAESSSLSDRVPDVAEKGPDADQKKPLAAAKPRDEKLRQQAGRAGLARQSAGGGFQQNFYFDLSEAKNSRRLMEAGQAALEENAELVYVEASEPQIKAVLEELDLDDVVFQSVDVKPAADVPSQQPLERYRRGVTTANELGKQNTAEYGRKIADERDKRRLATQQAGVESKQNSQAGIAYRLTPGLNQWGLNQSAPAMKNEKTEETANLPAGDENRLQVLFVLRPAEDAKPPAAAAAEKNPKQD
jgi:hypothetical protein